MAKNDTVPVVTQPLKDGVLLAPSGEIDLLRSPSMRSQIAAAMTAKPRRVVVDLSGVPYMDSSGVATLVEALQAARKTGAKLVLCAGPRVKSILEISRWTPSSPSSRTGPRPSRPDAVTDVSAEPRPPLLPIRLLDAWASLWLSAARIVGELLLLFLDTCRWMWRTLVLRARDSASMPRWHSSSGWASAASAS